MPFQVCCGLRQFAILSLCLDLSLDSTELRLFTSSSVFSNYYTSDVKYQCSISARDKILVFMQSLKSICIVSHLLEGYVCEIHV